jgi:hypothetical protein
VNYTSILDTLHLTHGKRAISRKADAEAFLPPSYLTNQYAPFPVRSIGIVLNRIFMSRMMEKFLT